MQTKPPGAPHGALGATEAKVDGAAVLGSGRRTACLTIGPSRRLDRDQVVPVGGAFVFTAVVTELYEEGRAVLSLRPSVALVILRSNTERKFR